jgi:hypothetical protein
MIFLIVVFCFSVIIFADYIMAPLDILAGVFSRRKATRGYAFGAAHRLLKLCLWVFCVVMLFRAIFWLPDGHWGGVFVTLGLFWVFFFPRILEPFVFRFLSFFYSHEEMQKGVYQMGIGGSDKKRERREKLVQRIWQKRNHERS